MECNPGCAACCIAASISSPIPGMEAGKPAGTPCIHLTAEHRCGLFGRDIRPLVCSSLQPAPDMCGSGHEQAMVILAEMECMTSPQKQRGSL